MSTQGQIAITYDVSNAFFQLWLDKRMNYSCALFSADTETLEEAQTNKLRWFYEATRLSRESHVVDIGCGWGGNLEFLSKDMGLRNLTGITLSRAQYEELVESSLPGVTIYCLSYTDFQPERPFDAAISIGMFEHLATPQQAHSGENVRIYRDYFRRVWEWTRPGAWFGLQTVIGGRIPRDRKVLEEIGWTTYSIFPGAISPRIEAIVESVSPYWEIMEMHTRRKHYEKTATEWLRRLNANESIIRENWGDELFQNYQRYLSACVMAFAEGYQSLAQFALRRVD